MGFCSEPDKTVCEDWEDVQVDSSPGGTSVTAVAHFIADNVDHSIQALDGLGTFHGMGIISATRKG